MLEKNLKLSGEVTLRLVKYSTFGFSLYRNVRENIKAYYFVYDPLPEMVISVPLVPVLKGEYFMASERLAFILFDLLEEEVKRVSKID